MPADITAAVGKHPTAKRQAGTRRHAPYARPYNTRSYSVADYVIGICKRLSTPLFSRSPGSRSSADAFSVPWRTVDRETAQLREELYRAQCEAAAVDEQQLQAEQKTHEPSPPASRGKSPAYSEIPDDGSPYESVFDTARRIAERRASGLETPSLATSKGKEIARSDTDDTDDLEDVDFEPNETEDDDEEELLQNDIEPIDDSEEVTTSKNASDSSASDIIFTAPSPIDSSIEKPLNNSTQQTASDTEDQSVVISVEEGDESDSEEPIGPDQIEEPQSLSASTASPDAESDNGPEVEVEVSVSEDNESSSSSDGQLAEHAVYDSASESSSDDSDLATEELASISSDQSEAGEEEIEAGANDQSEAESQHERKPIDASVVQPAISSAASVVNALQQTPHTTAAAAATPSSRGWWPFANGSILGSLLPPQKKQPPRPTHPVEPEDDEEHVYAGTKRSADESSETITPAYGVTGTMQPQHIGRQRVLPKNSRPRYSRPFVPASFIDVSRMAAAGGAKHPSAPDRTEPRQSILLSSRRHTAALPTTSTPLASATPSAETARLSSVSSASSPPSAGPSATPLITAASLGLEARRSIVRGRSGQSRRRTCLYYGAGYGSRSDPYAFTPSNYSASVAAVRAPQGNTRSAVQSSYSNAVAAAEIPDTSEDHKSSTTAQRILDIIGEAPPTRSQQGLDSQDVINPYELSSPYSVRMRPKTSQRRRVLVPTSTRIPQAGSADSNPTRARSILDSIQSAAPPEILARLGAMSKASAPEKPQDLSAINSEPISTLKLTAAPAFLVPQNTEAVSSVSASISTLQSPPPPIKAQFATPATAIAAGSAAFVKPTAIETPTKVREAPALTTSAIKPIDKENQLPYAFNSPLPLRSGADDAAAKAAVSKLALAELPSFAFALSDEQQPAPSSTLTQPADPTSPKQQQAEWTCDVCELVSPATANRCIVCDAAKPSATVTVAAPSQQASANSGKPLLQAPAVLDSEWVCEVCELKSPASAQKCIVCDAAKPNPASGNATGTSAAAFVAPPTSSTFLALASAAAPTSSEWVCDVCELKSPATADRCTICDAAKPTPASATTAGGSVAAAPIPTSGTLSALASAAAPTSSEWVCDICELKSPATADKCTVCDAAKPTSAASSSFAATSSTVPAGQQSSAATASQGPSFSFKLDVAKLPSAPMQMPAEQSTEQWECEVCELKNPMTASKCTICDAARPTSTESLGQQSSTVETSQDPSFSFELDLSKQLVSSMQSGQGNAPETTGSATEQWECEVCELKNPSAADKCTICDAAKPVSATSVSTASTSLAKDSIMQGVSELPVTELPTFDFDLDVMTKQPSRDVRFA
ncbi:hypothetical protein H4R24_002156 [Coemansia sp. RSA 988]|nr:hypothetical protein H4R24_002156 [Coemansia sp. RSA 988]